VNLLRLYISTLSHLKPGQLFYLARQRLLSGRPVRLKIPLDIQYRAGISLGETLAPVLSDGPDYEFRFLNVSRSFSDGAIDWECIDMPKLWRYNLHYFDYLQEKNRSDESLAAIVSDWIDKNRVGAEDAWEPYTVSLRIVNWVKWFLSCKAEKLPQRNWLESLYFQAAWLEKNIEYHLLANHYLKNAKALFFAGAYFSGVDADRWLRKGLKILCEEASEQILSDGGHYERSPMYHCIVTEDYLDVLNLCIANAGLVDQRSIEILQRCTAAALDYLNDILLPDGQIPLFNDSAFGIAPAPEQIFHYAQQVMQYNRPARRKELDMSANPESGYYAIRDGGDMLIVDCGQIGPDYQPGHAHCDTLSYELAFDGRRVIVDAGVFDYENSGDRRYSRSTCAHNTVVIDNEEQSEIWGVFRVARRARPLHACLKQVDDKRIVFEGAHNGYYRLPGKVIHKRIVEYERTSGWFFRDNLLGNGTHYIESFIHLAPDLKIRSITHGQLMILEDRLGAGIAEIRLPDNLQVEVVKGNYFPEFGVREVNQVVRLFDEVELPFYTNYGIRSLGSEK